MSNEGSNDRWRAAAATSMGKVVGLRGGGMGLGLKDLAVAAEKSITDELAFRKAEEAAARRYEAVGWLREMDPVASDVLPARPSEEDFCLALRNGLILCNVLNRVNPGAVPKVVENPVVAVQSTEGAAQSVIQYFENMRNFLVAVEAMQLLTFEASDLEKGGSSVKVVDCILCLKGYYEWKLAGGIGIWRYGGTVKITSLSRDPPSSHLTSPSSEEQLDDPNQQLSRILSKADKALGVLFDQFGIGLLKAFLTAHIDTEDLSLNERFIDLVLEQAFNEFHLLLSSQRNQLGLLLKRFMTDEKNTLCKEKFLEAVVVFLKENGYDSSWSSQFCLCGSFTSVDKEKKLDYQQKQLEILELSFNEMKDEVECKQKKWEENLEKLEHHIQGLEVNALSYSKLLEENHLLYNQLQDLKGSIRVYCRVRPSITEQSDGRCTVEHIGQNGDIMIANPNKEGRASRKIFSFNKVFGENAKQVEIFADIQPLIRSVMDGYNVCIFAYGQTGSGKTYTMSGPDITTNETWGVNYRALNDLFYISNSREGLIMYDISVQMVEIYNEQVRDLLVSDGSNRRLDIRNNSQFNGLNIPDASLVQVKCTKDVLDLMKIGLANRAVGATALNERSSRSHSVLTVHVQGKELASGSKLRGCLHLVDLAGSERVDKSEATGERLKEAQHINRSLSALGDVISALAQKSAHIPYRNSKLTQLLQDALGGQAKTLMFVHINPEANAFSETISTLKFAARVASIELGAAHVNKEAGQVLELKEEISRLRSVLQCKENELDMLKKHNRQFAFEMQKPRTKSPSRAGMKSGSCSSGKQRKPFCSNAFLDKDLDKTPVIAVDNCISSKYPRSQSPQVRSSFSADRAAIVRTKAKIETLDERGPTKLQFPEKVSTNANLGIYPAPGNDSTSVCLDLKEIGNLRTFDKQKNKAESQLTLKHGRRTGSQKYDMEDREKEEVQMDSESSEIENVCSPFESLSNSAPKLKKVQHQPIRISQNMELRALVHVENSSMHRRQTNKHVSNSSLHSRKENPVGSELRRSRSLPRGRFVSS